MWEKIIKNTAWLFGGEFLARLLRAAIVIIAARLLGAVEWGILSYALSLAALFTIAADVGTSAVLTRELVKRPKNRGVCLATAFYLKLGLAAAAALLILAAAPYFSKIALSPFLLLLTGLLVISDNLRLLGNALARALEKMHLEAAEKVAVQGAVLIFGLAAVWYSASAQSLAVAYLAGSVAGLSIIAWLLRRWLKHLNAGCFDNQFAKKLLHASWPFALIGILGGIMLNTDIIMLGWFRSAADVGYYSAAQKMIMLLRLFPSLIATAVFPSLSRLANADKEKFGEVISQSLRIIFLLAFPITIGGLIIGPQLTIFVFGQQYQPTAAVFQLLAFTVLISFPAILINNALLAYERRAEFLKYSALGAGGNIFFNFLLIPRFGIEGAAAATIATLIISSGFIWFRLKKINNFTIGGRLNKIIAASAVMGAAVWLAAIWGSHVLTAILIGVFSYFGLLYLLHEPALIKAKEFLWQKKA